METLGQKRLGDRDFRSIVPLMLRERRNVPEVVSKFQYLDLSRISVQGRRYYSTKEFRERMEEVVRRIEEIAETLMENGRKPECDGFRFSEHSAFEHVEVPPQRVPFRDEGGGGHA